MLDERPQHWVGTWATAPAPLESLTLTNQTLRMIARVSIGGASVRVRISNAYGSADLHVGAATVARRRDAATVEPTSVRTLTFSGNPSIAIPAGALVVSDPVELDVPPLTDLAVNVHLPETVTAEFGITGHDAAHQTGYISTSGNHSGATDLPVAQEVTSFLFVSGVDVLASGEVGGIVAFGDSLTEGNLSTLDANQRWPDQLARRLVARIDGRQFGVVNQGIGGGRLLHDLIGDSGLRRFDRDVLAQPGATHVVVLLGINDLRNSRGKPEEIVTAEQLIAGLTQLARRAHDRGLVTIVGTVMTWEHETFNGGHYSAEGEAKRLALDEWIRGSRAFDAVIDFEAALRDPAHPTRMQAEFDSGDHLHPSDAGYRQMADSIDLSLFDARNSPGVRSL